MRTGAALALAGALAAWAAPPGRAQAPGEAPVPGLPGLNSKVLYDAGRFGEAVQAFRSRADKDPLDPWAHYNLGNALYKAGRLGPAIASYLRAFDIEPRDEDLRFNLDFALRRAGDALYPEDLPRAIFVSFHILSVHELEGLQWLLLWLAILSWSAWILLDRHREDLLPAVLLFASLWGACALWWVLLDTARPDRLAVTVAPRTELRNGPGEGFSVGFTAPEGRRVSVLQEKGEWVELGVLKEGVKGWVQASSLERVW